MGQLLRALLGKLAGAPWTEAGFADAVRETLNTTVTDHDGCKGKTFLANLLAGAAGPRLYRTSRFLNLTDDAGVCRWTSQLIQEWYPARIAKRGEAYGLQMHEHYDLILQCFKSWGTQQIGKEPDRWDINDYLTIELPAPNAEQIEHARHLRQIGWHINDIAEALDFGIGTIAKWCKDTEPPQKNAALIKTARVLEKQGVKRKDIAEWYAITPQTLGKWMGKKCK